MLKLFTALFFALSLISCSPEDVIDESPAGLVSFMLEKHYSHPKVDQQYMRGALERFISNNGPFYPLDGEIEKWTKPNHQLIQKMLVEHAYGKYTEFESIFALQKREREYSLKIAEAVVQKQAPIQIEELFGAETPEGQRLAKNIYDKLLSEANEAYTNRRPGADYTAVLVQYFQQEKEYDQQKLKDNAFLLNLVNAFAPDFFTTLWDEPLVTKGDEIKDDSYKDIYDLNINFLEDNNGLYVSSIKRWCPTSESSLHAGDVVTEINGHSYKNGDWSDAYSSILKKGAVVKVLRDNKELVVNVDPQQAECAHPPEIGLISLSNFRADVVKIFEDNLKKLSRAQGLIIDLRDDPGGETKQLINMISLFVSHQQILVGKNEKGSIKAFFAADDKKAWDNKPIIILVNQNSASCSELFSTVLKDFGLAIIIGEKKTIGKGVGLGAYGIHNEISSDGADHYLYKFSIANTMYFGPSGYTPQENGIKADIIVRQEDVYDTHFSPAIPAETIAPFGTTRADFRKYIPELQKRSEERLRNNSEYQEHLRLLDNVKPWLRPPTQKDFQLEEAFVVMEDLIAYSGGF